MADREKVIKGLESLHERLLDAAMWDSVAMLDALMVAGAIYLLKEQEEEIRQLRLALQIMNGNGIRVDTKGR